MLSSPVSVSVADLVGGGGPQPSVCAGGVVVQLVPQVVLRVLQLHYPVPDLSQLGVQGPLLLRQLNLDIIHYNNIIINIRLFLSVNCLIGLSLGCVVSYNVFICLELVTKCAVGVQIRLKQKIIFSNTTSYFMSQWEMPRATGTVTEI